MNNSFAEIADQLNKAVRVAIFCHGRPDGDTLGSGLALGLALENAGKKVYTACEDLPPQRFSFLPCVDKVVKILPNLDFDLLVSVDCSDISRLGIFQKRYKNFKKATVNIDHHISNVGYAKFNYVKVCPATCEIMTEFLQFAGYEITEDMANLLMAGLLSDSGTFTHLDVSENTFKIAAYLRSKGADVNRINYNFFVRQPKERALLYGRAINKIRFALDDKFAFVIISQKDLQECAADSSLTEGFVDFPLTIDGVEVSASIMEFKNNQYKVSLRSKGKVKVNLIASGFGGGGHVLASGCMLFGELEEVIERLTYAVYQNL